MRIRDRLAISARRERQAARAMELCLMGFVFVGLYEGEPGIVVNSLLALGVTQLPPLLERDYDISMDGGLVLWMTTAVFLHALGTVGIPGVWAKSLYRTVWWYDHLTHALSSTLVAAVGYAFVRAVEEHTATVSFPPSFVFVFILVVTIAFGVGWEVVEFAIGSLDNVVGANVLTQYGLEDTMLDLIFDIVGGLAVAAWGTAYLTDLSGSLAAYLDRRARG